jgi:hypothetical protein
MRGDLPSPREVRHEKARPSLHADYRVLLQRGREYRDVVVHEYNISNAAHCPDDMCTFANLPAKSTVSADYINNVKTLFPSFLRVSFTCESTQRMTHRASNLCDTYTRDR